MFRLQSQHQLQLLLPQLLLQLPQLNQVSRLLSAKRHHQKFLAVVLKPEFL